MPTPEIVDCHTHTFFSDGEGTFEENVRAALAAGCTTLASTDHLTLPHDMDPDCECSVPETDLREHRKSFVRVLEDLATGAFGEAGKRLELVYGFEADWYEGCEENIAKWRGDAVFLLGSIHFIDGMAIDYAKEMDIWDSWGADTVWRTYVDRWCTACFSAADFDSMALPDLGRLVSNCGYAPSIPLEPLWDRMAGVARACGAFDRRVAQAMRRFLSCSRIVGAVLPRGRTVDRRVGWPYARNCLLRNRARVRFRTQGRISQHRCPHCRWQLAHHRAVAQETTWPATAVNRPHFRHTVTIRVLFVMALTRHYAVFYLFRRLFFQDEKATNGDGSIVFAPFLSFASNTGASYTAPPTPLFHQDALTDAVRPIPLQAPPR